MAGSLVGLRRVCDIASPHRRCLHDSGGYPEGPVGLACVEQDSDAVVVEVGEPERGAFDAFGEVDGGLGGCVGYSGRVPVRDLGAPAPQGAAQPVDLWCEAEVLEIDCELFDGIGAEFGVGDVIDASQGLVGVPGQADLAFGVACIEQSPQPDPPVVGDALRGRHEQFADPVQRVVFAAAVPERVVLDSAADLVKGVVAQPYDVERVRDLLRGGRRRVERGPIRSREVQHRPTDGAAPCAGPLEQPLRGRFGRPASDYVQQLAPSDVDDASRPSLGAEPSPPPHQVFVEAQRPRVADPGDIRGQQRLAPAAHRHVHRMPTASQLRSDLFERAATARLTRGPAAGACRQPLPRRRNSGVLLGDGAKRASSLPAAPPALVPHQPHRPPERREVHQLHQPSRRWTTTARHKPHSPVSAPARGHEPPTVHQPRRQHRAPRHRPDPPTTHTRV